MLATAQSGSDFQKLNTLVKEVAQSALDGLPIATQTLEIPIAPVQDYRALPPDTIAFVERGTLTVVHQGTVVSVLDKHDIVLPDTDYVPEHTIPLIFGSDTGATLRLYNKADLYQLMCENPERQALWAKAMSLHVSLLLRLNALHIRETFAGGTGSEYHAEGSIIIQQGDPADDIYSMIDGAAEVLVNDIVVGRIGVGEMFGTMAALTNSHRNATVRATEPCEVIRVPKERFFELIQSQPASVQSLLVDMAKSITELNAEIVRLRELLNN
jgi:CRP-like cAMP-binding protein